MKKHNPALNNLRIGDPIPAIYILPRHQPLPPPPPPPPPEGNPPLPQGNPADVIFEDLDEEDAEEITLEVLNRRIRYYGKIIVAIQTLLMARTS